jgi:hypothetical protein
MVIQTAISITCCRGPTESKTSGPWPEHDAYGFGGYPQCKISKVSFSLPHEYQDNVQNLSHFQDCRLPLTEEGSKQ